MKKKILIIEPHKLNSSQLKRALYEYDVHVSPDPSRAIIEASDFSPDVVVLELSLAGHSGLEFLYEFRTYDDWRNIPVIIYTSVLLNPSVLQTNAWKQLSVAAYIYKPERSLADVVDAIEAVAYEP